MILIDIHLIDCSYVDIPNNIKFSFFVLIDWRNYFIDLKFTTNNIIMLFGQNLLWVKNLLSYA